MLTFHSVRIAKKGLIGQSPISSQIAGARFNAVQFRIGVTRAHAPTASPAGEDIVVFYNSIEKALAITHKEDIVIIRGGWNAKVGSDNTDWKHEMEKIWM